VERGSLRALSTSRFFGARPRAPTPSETRPQALWDPWASDGTNHLEDGVCRPLGKIASVAHACSRTASSRQPTAFCCCLAAGISLYDIPTLREWPARRRHLLDVVQPLMPNDAACPHFPVPVKTRPSPRGPRCHPKRWTLPSPSQHPSSCASFV
jgi:hypothetical protein